MTSNPCKNDKYNKITNCSRLYLDTVTKYKKFCAYTQNEMVPWLHTRDGSNPNLESTESQGKIRIRDSTTGIRESNLKSNKSSQAFLVTPAIYSRVWELMRLHCAVPVAIGGRGHLINTVITFRY